MKCTITDLEVGKEYSFLRASREQLKDIPIYHGKLLAVNIGERVITAKFAIHEFNDAEAFIMRMVASSDCKTLEKPDILSSCDHRASESARLLERTINQIYHPKYWFGWMISDSDENAIMEYEEFLNNSNKEFAEKIEEMDEFVKPEKVARLEQNKQLYAQQISWLKENYLKS